MIRTAGHVVRHTSRVLHLLIVVVMSLLFGASLALVALAFRLSLGPIDLGWISTLRDNSFVFNDGSIGLSFQEASLAWDGFNRGVGFPLVLHLTEVRVIDVGGQDVATARQALVSMAIGPLLLGRFVPRTIELDEGVVSISLNRAGAPDLPLSTGEELSVAGRTEDTQPPELSLSLGEFVHRSDILGQLDHVRLRDFRLTLRGDKASVPWQASLGELELARQPGGMIFGHAQLPFSLDGQSGELTLRATLPRQDEGIVEATITPIQPAVVARIIPALAILDGLRSPATINATMNVTHDLTPVGGKADIHLDAGVMVVDNSQLSIKDGHIALSGTPDHVTIDGARLTVAGAKSGTVTSLSAIGSLERSAERLTASVAIGVDHLEVADLPALWPARIGGGARPWVVQNVTAGTISHVNASLVAETGTGFRDVTLTQATADLDADNVTISWLDPVPPIEHGKVHLHLMDPDQMIITMPSGQQRISSGGADLLVQDGKMLITGLSVKDQDTKITLRADGPVASAMTLLKEPRLKLLSKHPLGFPDPSGDASVTISLAFPLEYKLQPEQIIFQIGAHVEGVRIPALVAGRDVTDGIFDLTADKDGLTLKGQASLAGIPVNASGFMDFNPGPPGQVQERVTANGRPTVGQLSAAGVDFRNVLTSGAVPLIATYTGRRNGEASVGLNADLGPAAVQVEQLGWHKPVGVPSTASATIMLAQDRVTSVRDIVAESTDLSIAGSVNCPDAVLRSISLDRARIGKTDVKGTIQFPAVGPIEIVLSGPQLDLSTVLDTPSGQANPASSQFPDWSLKGRFDRLLLAHAERADGVTARASMIGSALRTLDITGSLSSGAAFSARIGAEGGSRSMTLDAADAGAIFRGSGLTSSIRSGRLQVRGVYNDAFAGHPLKGTAELNDFRIVDAPLLSKLLQAVTLYGLADLMSGPGIGINRAVVPFTYENHRLTIDDGRMYSTSLGATAKGLVDLATNQLSLTGTVVPVYMINSVLGRIPFLGKIFSPEVGGGVFAARYAIDGSFLNPNISVNPLSVLTPGFLRNLFDIGGANSSAR